jgi:hypothetical protein
MYRKIQKEDVRTKGERDNECELSEKHKETIRLAD